MSSDSNSPPPPGNKRPKPGPNRERSFWSSYWPLLICGILLPFLLLVWSPRAGKRVPFSDFLAGVEAGRFNQSNVYELTLTSSEIRFQNLPRAKGLDWDHPLSTQTDSEASKPSVGADGKVEPLQYFHVYLGGLAPGSIEELTKLLREKKIIVNGTAPETNWTTFGSMLGMFAVITLALMMFRRIGAGGAMSFGRSRGKLYAEDDVKITFEDVAGIEEALEELKEIVEFLKTPAKYQALGGRIPRGVLLVGPPGTGKTLLAKAVAGEAGVPFFSLSGSDFVELYVGVGASRVRDLFAQAVQRAPSIIFIDELDALGKRRGDGGPGNHDERDQTLNALLVEMDGFSSDQSVIVMAATNRPEILDSALMRPGRFDRHVLVDRPDYKGREAILKVHARKVLLDAGVDLGHLAKLTSGFAGADLASLMNEAALLAARKNKSAVSMKELEEGIERVSIGLEKTSRIIQEDVKQRVAYHECGHALIACSLPHTDPVHKISIIPRGFGALGYTLHRPEDDRQLLTQTELSNRLCVLLGGIGAEELIYQETSTGAQNDLERASDLARRMVMEFGMSPKIGRVNYHQTQRSPFRHGSNMLPADFAHSEQTMREIDLEVKRILDEIVSQVRDILKDRRDVLEHMTKDLLEVEVMDSAQLHAILEAHKTGPQIKPGTFVERLPSEPMAAPEAGSHSVAAE